MSLVVTCRKCGGDLVPGDRFCGTCGVSTSGCLMCGATLLAEDRFCSECGTPATPTAARSRTPSGRGGEAPSPWKLVLQRLRAATLGEYEIVRELGRGGMAAVYLAHDLTLERLVAIKVMSPGLLMGEGMVERFRREAVTVASLNHHNIVSIHAVRESEDLHFFVMRYVDGRALDHILRDAGALPIPIVRSILFQVGSALSYAHRHRKRVVHRDVKPANILLDEEGNAVVTDFGIAKVAESPGHTQTGAMVGTPAYMSPEQCFGAGVTGASDQYSLGIVAYEMLTGRPPFGGPTLLIMQGHTEKHPAPIREARSDCPSDLEAAVARMLEKDPAARWPNMGAALAALGAAPLADHDPLRAELVRLATPPQGWRAAEAASPTSPAPPYNSGSSSRAAATRGPTWSLSVSTPPESVEVGESFQLRALVRDSDGRLATGHIVAWTCNDPSLLEVDGATGTAYALAPGAAVLTASTQGLQASVTVRVSSARVARIDVSPPSLPVRVGDQVQLTATPLDRRGAELERPITWRSDNPACGAVTPAGLLTARAPGIVRLTAEAEAGRSEALIRIEPAGVAAIYLAPLPGSITIGETITLLATPLDAHDNPLGDRPITWASNDIGIVTVTVEGVATGLAAGAAVITATSEGKSATAHLNVSAEIVDSISVSESVADLEVGSTVDQAEPLAVVEQSTAHTEFPTRDAPSEAWLARAQRFWWTLPIAAAVVALTVYVSGKNTRPPADTVEAPGTEPTAPPGEDTLAILGYEPAPRETSATAVDTGTLTGSRVDVASVAITKRPTTPMTLPGSMRLEAVVKDRDEKPIQGREVIWSSRNPRVAQVNPTTGRLQSVSGGRAVIVATSDGLSDSVLVTVRATELVLVASIRLPESSVLRVGDTIPFKPAVLDGRGRALSDEELDLSSSDPAVATVDSRSGKLVGITPGTTTITARKGSASATAMVTVLRVMVAAVTIEPPPRRLLVGDTLTLSAIVKDATGRLLTDRSISWATDRSDVASIEPSSGLLRARSPGSTAVTATVESKLGTLRLVIAPRPPSRVQPKVLAKADSVRAGTESNPPISPADAFAAEMRRGEAAVRGAATECFEALTSKNVARLTELYDPATALDRENLKKLRRALQTKEWGVSFTEKTDAAPQITPKRASLEFSVRYARKDSFGGKIGSKPTFRVDLEKAGDDWRTRSCRVLGTPDL